jgi:MFS transporter, DHA1 family, staphyloferrin A biosynthesis exporter
MPFWRFGRSNNSVSDKLNGLDEYREGESASAEPRRAGSLRLPKTFVSLENPIYRLYYASMAGHWSSMNMQMVARSLQIYRINDSGAILGLASLAAAIPMIVFALPAGVIADRVQKRTVLIWGQVGSAVVSLGVALSMALGYLGAQNPESWWVLIVSAVIQGTIMGLILPSRQAIISEIVSEEHLMNAISLNNMGMNVFRILAPAFTGVLIDSFGFYIVYLIITGLYIMGAVCIAMVPPTRTQTVRVSGGTLNEVLDGWRYIRREKTIFLVLVFTVLATVLGMPYSQLLPMFTEGILHVGATEMGILISVSGAGAIVASLVIASLPNKRRGIIMVISGLVMGVALLAFSFSSWWFLSLGVIAFVGMGSSGQMALGNSLIQYYSDVAYRGRVMSFFMMGFGFGSLGAFVAGILAQVAGVQWAVGSMAALLVIVAVWVLVFTPPLRKLD